MAHESGRFTTLQESLNYSATALVSLFGRHRISVADAERYGRTTSHAADQAALASILYGGEWGRVNLGNTKSGDGWKFRGRGLKQVTGAANYAACGAALSLPLLENPDLLLLPEYAASSAGWFWASRRMNALADARDVVAMTKVVTGGGNGLAERTALFKSACLAFGI
jgi:putative chitinase